MDDEASPTLLPVPGVDIEQYKSQLIERFANPGIRDTVRRWCAESSERIPKWVLPVLRRNLDSGGSISHADAIVASWADMPKACTSGRTDRDRRPVGITNVHPGKAV